MQRLAEEEYSPQYYADCRYSTNVPQAYDHNTVQRLKAWRANLVKHL